MFPKTALLIGAVLVTAPLMRADTTYTTVPSWNGSSSISTFGPTFTSTYGETFVAPTDNTLQSFTFYLESSPGAELTVNAAVYAWGGSLFGGNPPQGAFGPALYFGPDFVVAGTGAFTPENVNTGGVTLTPGNNYVILFTITSSDAANSTTSAWDWGLSGPPVAGDGGGGFNFYNNGNDAGLLNTTGWDDFSDFGDLAYTATFTGSPVPEPSSLALLGTGILGFAGLVRLRLRR